MAGYDPVDFTQAARCKVDGLLHVQPCLFRHERWDSPSPS